MHIFGDKTNVMTAGGFAKHELLRSLYPNKKTKRERNIAYQKAHPLTQKKDEYARNNSADAMTKLIGGALVARLREMVEVLK